MNDLLLGLDVGSSSVKASVVDAQTGKSIVTAQSPDEEMTIVALQHGWAEQDPELWWQHVTTCIRKCLRHPGVKGDRIKAIGISYQMHGLVIVDKARKPLRNSIIWCDSRAVALGDEAFRKLGSQFSLEHYLNSPGNFTASKLKWVKENEPSVFEKVDKMMLPGDYIAMKLTGEVVTTDSGLSEGILWDYHSSGVATKLLDTYGISQSVIARHAPVFSVQGKVRKEIAQDLGISDEAVVSYRAGDQPNNAFSLNVVHAGETAATAGTSGVIYSVTDKNTFDPKSRVNTFIHVNNNSKQTSNGVLLCINGTGILNSWIRKNLRADSQSYSYEQMNTLAQSAPIGADGLSILPFGNGAERVLENRSIGASFHGLDLNRHSQAHILRAVQEGIVFAMNYGLEILQGMGLKSSVIRAGKANMFLSPLFREAFVNSTATPLQLYNTDGATGAAIGAGVGAGIYTSFKEAFKGLDIVLEEAPEKSKIEQYHSAYNTWRTQLEKQL